MANKNVTYYPVSFFIVGCPGHFLLIDIICCHASYLCGARCSSMVRAFAHGAMGRRIDPSWGGPFLHGVDPLSYFSFQLLIHDWCNKGRGMCHPVCGMMHIKESLLLIRKSSPCVGSGFPLSLSEWSFTICLTPYNR